MKIQLSSPARGIVLLSLAVTALALAEPQRSIPSRQIAIGQRDIGGVVTSTRGPEAGVWVIAETNELSTKFTRIVVTDDQGRYLLPDLPKAKYKTWVRGYGLVDSKPVTAVPGQRVDLKAIIAPSPRAAAEYYPASYWYSLLEVPPKNAFPLGGIENQEQWINLTKMVSLQIQQIGDKATREIPEALGKHSSTAEAFDQWMQSGESPVPFRPQDIGKILSASKSSYVKWLDAIAAGAYPQEPPPRPRGVERNVVISLWDWSTDKAFIHDEISTDKRKPTVNANGQVYGLEQFSDDVMDILDPVANATAALHVPSLNPHMPVNYPVLARLTWGDEQVRKGTESLHSPLMDSKGRIWMTAQIRMGSNQPDFCKQGSSHPSAKLFPLSRNITMGDKYGRELAFFDPKTREFTEVDTCFGTHHFQFGEDPDDTLGISGGDEVVGWFKTRVFDQTRDIAQAQGWCPLVLDTNGNGRLDSWTEPDPLDGIGQRTARVKNVDPTKDKRIMGHSYGVIVHPDGSIWQTFIGTPGAVVRTDPKTCLSEIYEPPFYNSKSQVNGFNPKGIDVDSNGLIWVFLASSTQIASFDRSKCKVLNGPAATGQQCPEGWTLYPVPGPKFKGVTDQVSSDFLYYGWVDQFNTLGLGNNVPIAPGTNSDSLLAFLPDKKQFVILRVPYPLGFYARGLDGRIDDPNGGWKGRGVWSAYATVTPWHIEGGKGTKNKVVKFQIRPHPLAD